MSDSYNAKIMERQRYIDDYPDEMTESERWWRDMGKQEQRDNAMRTQEILRQRRILSLDEVRGMTDEALRGLNG